MGGRSGALRPWLCRRPPSHGRENGWAGHDDLRCAPLILRGTPAGTAMIRRERRVTGPRFRCIVAGERGEVGYVTLAGLPLATGQLPLLAGSGRGARPEPARSLKALLWRRDGPWRPGAVRALARGWQGLGRHLARSGREVFPVGVSRARRCHTLSFPETDRVAAGHVALNAASCVHRIAVEVSVAGRGLPGVSGAVVRMRTSEAGFPAGGAGPASPRVSSSCGRRRARQGLHRCLPRTRSRRPG